MREAGKRRKDDSIKERKQKNFALTFIFAILVLFCGGSVYWHWQAFGLAEGVLDTLTALEREVAVLVAQGYTNREIAEQLHLAEQTVRNYLSAIYQKVGVKNRAGLTNYAWQQGWMDKSADADSR